MFVDSDHAGDQCTQRLCTGFLIETFFIKEMCTFGTEFVATKTGVKTLCGIHYKLHMMSIPIDGATHIYGDSMSVINDTSKSKSIIKKKNIAVCYHTV